MTDIATGDARALTSALVRIDSRNPSLAPGAAGEGAVAHALAGVLRAWGATVELVESSAGRPCVVARYGTAGERSLMLNGHLDTVGVEHMVHAPWDAHEANGRLYGRGSTDMKAGVASMCAAAARAAAGTLAGEVVITAVTDEEFESAGTRTLLARGVRASVAIVTEPTRLAICPAHRGFAWVEVTVHGRAAHGSRYDVGVDAIRGAALVLAELDVFEERELTTHRHPLLGHASLHAATIEGGIGWSTYPDRCVLRIERRTLPGETPAQALAEVEDACARVRATRAALRTSCRLVLAQAPSDVSIDAPVVRALHDALAAAGEPVTIEGMSAWTDAALLNAAGIPAICFGPGDIGLAHAAEEYVALDEIDRATVVLEHFITRWLAP